MNLDDGDFVEVFKGLMVLLCYVCSEEIVSFVVYLVGLEVVYIIGVSLIIDGGFLV